MIHMSTRKLIIREALSLYNALPALDGHVVETTTESKGEKNTSRKVVPYVFGADGKGGGKVRWNIAKNIDILKAEADRFNKVRDALIMEISGGSPSIPEDNREAINALSKRVQELLDSEVEISGLLTISLADLNLENNPDLTPSALAPLMSLIVE